MHLFFFHTHFLAARLRELERKMLKPPEAPGQREKFERQAKRYRWICCDQTFTSVRTGGCQYGKHGFSPKGTEPTNKLTQTIIDEWEETCLRNDEYNEKWLFLAREE